MPDTNLCFLDATELARRLRRREISAREVMAAHLAQIERVNPKVNAIVTLVAEQAMAEAAAADERFARGRQVGILHGLPVAHKDLHETKGIRTTYGSPIYADFVPDFDCITVKRLKAAGAITLGKTNTPEFGLGSQTFNPVFGATRNPYDLTKTCGGSSGGAAVALACGMVPIADGSDMGGSLRNPANFNNVVGFRTSPGRVPGKPGSWSNLSVDGPMARTVGDVALMLAAMAGPDPASPISITESADQFLAALERDFRGVPVAFSSDFGGLPVDPRVQMVLESARSVFNGLGCTVEDACPDLSGVYEAFQTFRAVNLVETRGELLETHRELLKDTAIWNIEKGFALTGGEVAQAGRLRTTVFNTMKAFMDRYEFLVVPVNQVPPFSVDEPYPTSINGVPMETYIDWMKSCFYITVTGHPAISVPCGFTTEGLPVGVQIVGRYRDEFGVLQLAHAFEAATQIGRQRPPLTAS
ncbi:MAG: amidase [Dehalococcoidia bacterium]